MTPSPTTNKIVVECHNCSTHTIADELFRVNDMSPEDPLEGFALKLVRCRDCGWIILICQNRSVEPVSSQETLGAAWRLWPAEAYVAPDGTPAIVTSSLSQAVKSFKAEAFTAAAVMCRRALEAICSDQNATGRDLQKKLNDLHERKIIDDMIYDWTESLRKAGNIGAHDVGKEFSREDADDMQQFTIAICDYIYRLSVKYGEFKLRLIAKSAKEPHA